MNGYVDLLTIAHEMGHGYGLGHSPLIDLQQGGALPGGMVRGAACIAHALHMHTSLESCCLLERSSRLYIVEVFDQYIIILLANWCDAKHQKFISC